MGRPSIIPQIEKKFNQDIESILQDQANQGNKPAAIADNLGIKKSLAYELLKHFDIKIKSITPDNQSNFDLDQSYSGNPSTYFVNVFQDFMIAKEISNKTKPTLDFYRNNLSRYLWWLQDQGIGLDLRDCFTVEVVRRFLHYVQTSEVRFGGRSNRSRSSASRSTVDCYYRVLSVFGSWLFDEGKIDPNPMLKIQKPKQIKVVIPEIPRDVIIDLVNNRCDDSMMGLRNKAIILIFIDTGVRLNELVEIKKVNINFETGLVKIFGKGQKERYVRLSEFTKSALISYLEARDQVAKNGSFWIDIWGGELTYRGVIEVFNKFQDIYPDIPLNPHSFRHTWALNLYRKTRDLLSLKDLGGWTTLAMPEHYAAAISHEDALKAHEIGSPVEDMFNGKESHDQTERTGKRKKRQVSKEGMSVLP